MITCNLCGIEKSDGRQMHGHMMKVHPEEYAAVNNDLEKVTEGYTRASKNEPKKAEKTSRPDRLRLLNKYDPDELEAYNVGYRYYDPEEDMAYMPEEIKELGWM